jgi:hypothetical protein
MLTNSTEIKRATTTAPAVAWQPSAPFMGVGVRAACQSPSPFRHNGGGLLQGYSIRPERFGLEDRRQFQV